MGCIGRSFGRGRRSEGGRNVTDLGESRALGGRRHAPLLESRGSCGSGVGLFAVACAEPTGFSQTDIVPYGATSTLGVAIDQWSLWFGTSSAIERFVPPSTTPTIVAPAIAGTGPFLAVDATRVYWVDALGSIRAAAR